MADISVFEEQVRDRARRASEMKKALLSPIMDDSGAFIPVSGAGKQALNERFALSARDSIYESAGDSAPMVMGTHAGCMKAYMQTHNGALPPEDLLASAHLSIENILNLTGGKATAPGIFESAEPMSTTDGILMRDRMISLVLPVLLQSVTANMVTLIPGQFNRSELFRIRRIAGSTFGDLKRGDVINYAYNGRYAVMDQMALVGTGDGTKKDFTLDTQQRFGTAYPLKKNTIKIIHDHDVVGADNGNGNLFGACTLGGVSVTISGTVDYSTGVVQVSFTVPPVAGVSVHIGYDVSIEKDATLIPRIDHEMDSRILYPHESAISGNATLQALWSLRRELGIDIENMTMQGLRNILAADKDRKILRDMYFYAKGSVEWEYEGAESLTLREHYETLNKALLHIDSALMLRTGVSGLVGLVGDANAVNVFRYLPEPYFKPAPGYRSIAQPHYVGTVFGQWDLYCDPAQEAYTCLCYAKGPDHGQTGYVTGDAVPALSFRHPVLGDLISKSTMWELAYRDLQPFDGRDYLMTLKMTPTA